MSNVLANLSQAAYVELGYGQVEPNHLSAQRNGQIYAQLPANGSITVLENGQFVKYDYKPANGNKIGEVNFSGDGEWMLVFNEIKLYRDGQRDCEFAMLPGNYNARLYSPAGAEAGMKQSRYYNGVDDQGNDHYVVGTTYKKTADVAIQSGKTYYVLVYDKYEAVAEPDVADIADYYEVDFAGENIYYDDVTAPAYPFDPHYNEDPFHIFGVNKALKMDSANTKMVPRVFKTSVGDIFTTNTIDETSLALGDILCPRATDGILEKVASGATPAMKWQVVKLYTMPDGQKGAKLLRIA